MTEQNLVGEIIRRRMHGLYLSRKCTDIAALSRELLGLHCWFHRNVCFSSLIRGVSITGWKTALVKTWLYRGTLHGAVYDDLPQLLALHPGESYLEQYFGKELTEEFTDKVLRYMEDGVCSRTEFREIFMQEYDQNVIDAMFSSWGGIFVSLARSGKVAFKSMTSRDFDLISAEPYQTAEEVLPDLLRRYFTAYGPASLSDAAWFFGFLKDDAKRLQAIPLDEFKSYEIKGKKYYYIDNVGMNDIPEVTLLSGFDPLVVSYIDRSAVLKDEYKSKVVLKSGICNPTVAVNGQIAGLWNIKKNEPVIEFFTPQPKHIITRAMEQAEFIQKSMK